MRLEKLNPYASYSEYSQYYDIWHYHNHIGTIKYVVKGRFVAIGYMEIFKEYRKQGFGYKTVELLMKKYPTKSIIGESLKKSSGFWKNCIKKYDGVRNNTTYCRNCSFSFIIPQRETGNYNILYLLEEAFR